MGTFSFRTLKKVYDAKVIKAEFLIHHIDQAFEVFEKRSWNKYLPFDDFCELILPYRIGDEPWRNGVVGIGSVMNLYWIRSIKGQMW